MANEGNQWWAKRSKHGRGLLFSSPELMWSAACEYFAHEDNRTDLQSEDVGWYQGTAQVHVKTHKIPYTWQGLCLFFGCSLSYFRTRKTIWTKEAKEATEQGITDDVAEDFLAVLNLIEITIFKQQYDASQAGIFREGLTARYLKLNDATQLSTPNDAEGEGANANEFKVTLKLE